MPKLLKLALSNWRRQRLRTALTISSLVLSVGAVVFVYALSISFQDAGSAAIDSAIGEADIWIVPADGVVVDRDAGGVEAVGELPAELAQEVGSLPAVDAVVAPRGSGAGTLQVISSDPKATGDALGALDLTVSSDPARTQAEDGDAALAYLVTANASRFSAYSFAQEFESVQVNEVASSVLGVVGRVTLALGFLSVLTSLLISIEERRREFGILAAVGITDDVLYLFLTESAMLVAAGLLGGVLMGGILFATLLPAIFSAATVFKAIALVSVYFPIMLIGGALIPAWRLLQRSPLELLRSSP
ncbi:MAG: ABC transporter permease [Acidobacteria bacterium]|nr:MAG: ABC transporter permease [Acidobacteriota bacterium]GIK78711.1 MAG: ABC transporter substrate-binding protein [Actinomycetes bacterium]